MSGINDDIAASIASLSSGAAPPSAAPMGGDTTPPGGGNQSRDDVASALGTRNADGTFAGRATAPEARDGAPAPTGTGTATPPGDGQPAPAPAPAATDVSKDTPAPATGAQVFDPAKPPSAWTPEMKAKWDTLPEEARKEITRREEASYQGFEKFRKQVEPAIDIAQHVGQFEPYFKHIGVEAKPYIQNVIAMEQSLALGNPTQKMETIIKIGETYGVPLRQILDSALGGKLDQMLKEGHITHKTPAPLPPDVQEELQQSRQFRQQYLEQETSSALNKIVADKENYPLLSDDTTLESVKEQMAVAIETGKADNFEDAYAWVVFKNPELQARQNAIKNGQAQQDALRQRQQQAGNLTPPNAPAHKATPPAEAESIEDSIRQSIARMANAGGV